MPEAFLIAGRYLAYRWYRATNLDAAHEEAWDFAKDHCQEFVANFVEPDVEYVGSVIDPPFQPQEEDYDDPLGAALDYEGPSHLLAEK